MNKGLKNYTKQISLAVGNAAEVSINTNKKDANLHITLPLITTVGLCPIETSLVFNLQDSNDIELFGKGCKLNFYSKITTASNKNIIKNFDGSTDEYLSSNNYYNKETNLECKKIIDDEYGLIYHYEVKDKYDNTNFFNTHQNYPIQVKYKNGDMITTNFVAATKVISNGKGDEIRFTKNGNSYITSVAYYHDNQLVNKVEINYTNGYISRLVYKNGTSTVATTSLSFNDNTIIVYDDLSGYRMKFNIESGRVISYIDGYDTSFSNGHLSSIKYEDNVTTLTDYKGQHAYYFFDSNELPLFEMDDEGNVVETEYDSETKVLKSNSGVVETNRTDNLLGNQTLSSFNASGVTISKVNVNDPLFNKILGSSTYRITGTGTLTKRINVNGLATDNLMAILFGKQLTAKTDTSYVKVSLSCGYGRDADYFSKTTINQIFDLMTLGVTTEKSYDYIELEIKLVGNASIEIGGVQLIKKKFGSFYTYDESGNATDVGAGATVSSISYGVNNLPTSSIGADSSTFDYEYDNYGNLIKAKTSYGIKIENTFDETYKTNLLSNKVVNSDGSKILETRKTYTSNGRFVLTDIDELGNTTTYNEYDSFGKVKKVTNALNAVSNFKYNTDGTLNEIILSKGSNSTNAKYQYDSKKRISKVTLSNGCVYDFSYDNYNNLIQIKLNNVVVFNYEYDLTTGNLIKQKYGANSDAFIFEYNTDGLITKINYVNSSGAISTKFNYIYNDRKELVKITDANGSVLNEYEYDSDGKVTCTKTSNSEIKNSYDNLDNVVSKSVKINNKSIFTSYDSVNRSKGSHPESLYEPYKKSSCYLATFDNDGKLKYQDEVVLPINHSENEISVDINKEGVIPYINVGSNKRLSYKLECKSYYPDPSGCIQFWFKSNTTVASSTKKYLFSTKTSNSRYKDFIGLYLMGKKVYLEVTDFDGNHYDLLTSETDVDLSKWNFISLNFMNRYDGQGYPDVCEYALTLNAHMQIFKKVNPRLYVDCGPKPIINVGHKYDGSQASNDFSGRIACLMISKRKYVSLTDVFKYYRLTKDYIVDNQLVDVDAQTVDFSQTNLFTINQNIQNLFEIYPLQNSVTSLKGKAPIKFDIRNLSKVDKDRTFNFNNLIKRYAYVADGEKLVYDFNQSTSGTIVMRAFTDVNESKQYFFEGKDTQNRILGLYRDENNKICVDYNGTKFNTNLTFTTNEWHTIGLSFNHPATSNSQNNKYFDLRVFVDDNIWNATRITTFEYSQLTFSMGRKFNGVSTISNFGNYSNLYPLYGQIEMLATRAAYCEFLTLKELKDELVGLTRVNEFDEFGLLKKTEVHQAGKTILSNTYAYKTRSDSKYLSKQISSETIKVGNQSFKRNYTTDALGNLTSISDSTFGNHSYEYDYRGFLTKADGEKYEYDGNGNITRKGSINFVYDNVIKDRLVSVNGLAISYDSSNPLNPTKYGSKWFTFEGRRLTRLTLTSRYYDYKYNDQGLRIQKKDYRGITWDYTYDGDKLIYESSPYGKLNFLYDENNMLYGFIKDNTEKYLYIRDNLQNIIAITTLSGEIVVKYANDARGKLLSTTGSLASTIGALNPFKYKGYYYDQESGMYYCKSRYYVPDWCRWLNADNFNYLEFDNLNNCNAFAYCENDPVLGYDPNGTWSWTKFWKGVGRIATGVGAIVAGAMVIASGVALVPMLIVATITITAGVLTTVNGTADIVEAATDYNFVRDTIFQGDDKNYNIYARITESVAAIGSMICGGWLKYNSPRIKAYKSLGNYNIKTKHLPNSAGNWGKFCSNDQEYLRSLGKYALKHTSMSQLIKNSSDSVKLAFNLGYTVGTSGETCVRLVFSLAGKIITFFPF